MVGMVGMPHQAAPVRTRGSPVETWVFLRLQLASYRLDTQQLALTTDIMSGLPARPNRPVKVHDSWHMPLAILK